MLPRFECGQLSDDLTPPLRNEQPITKIMQRICFILLCSFVSFASFAQNGKIQGNISGPGNTLLSRITVSLEGISRLTQTDNEGNFSFNDITPGEYVLVATGVGYQAKSSRVRIEKSGSIFLTLELDIATATLREVVVSSKKNTQYSSALTRINTSLLDLPQSVQTIGRATMDEQQLFTVDQVLKNVAGVNQDANGSIMVRGFTTYSGAFLTNGLKGTPYPEGVFPLLGNVEKVEVIKGSTALLYGEGALGGNINLVTKQPKKITTVNASIGAGNLNLFRALGDVTGSINKKKSLYFLAGAAYQRGGTFTKNWDNENFQAYGSLQWDINEHTSWQLNANYVRDRSTSNWQPDIPVYSDEPRLFSLPNDFTYAGSDQKYKGDSYQLQSVLTHRLSNRWKAQFLLGYSESRADRRQYSNWGIDPSSNTADRSFSFQQLNSPTITINPYINGSFSIGKVKNNIAAGLDLTYDRNNYPNGIKQFAATPFNLEHPDYSPFDSIGATVYTNSRTEKFTYNASAAYLLDQLELSAHFKALIGLRFTNYFMRYLAISAATGLPTYDERPERTQAFTPRAGLVYQPVKTTSLYIDYNRGFTPQYSNERKYGGPFDPETSHQFELGYKGDYVNNKLHPSFALYRITKKNVLTYYEDASFPEGFGFRPLQQVVSKGVELGLTGNVTEELFLIANYSYNDARIAKSNTPDDIGGRFNNSPYNLANGWISYQFTRKTLKGLQAGAGINYLGQRKTYFGEVPDYTTLDAVISYRYHQYRLQINGNNLFDKRYAQNGGYGAYTPGAPRSFLITMSCSFK